MIQMRKHAIVTICVMLSFCLRANFLPEISGGARGGARGVRLPLIFRPNRGPKGRKKFSQTAPPLSQGLYDRTPLHLSEDLDLTPEIITQFSYLRIETTFTH